MKHIKLLDVVTAHPQYIFNFHMTTVWRKTLLSALMCKGGAVLLQAWSGPQGSRKLRFPDFVTTAQEGGKVVSLTHQLHLPPGNSPGTHFC